MYMRNLQQQPKADTFRQLIVCRTPNIEDLLKNVKSTNDDLLPNLSESQMQSKLPD